MKSKSFFDDDLPVELISLSKKLLKELDVSDKIFDHLTLIKWVKTFYERGKLVEIIYKNNNSATKYDFYLFCQVNTIADVKKSFNDIFNSIRFDVICKYFEIISKKHNYTKYHFRNSAYILKIQSEILNLLNYQNSYDYDFHRTAFKEINDEYKWCHFKLQIPNLDVNMFLYDEFYQLRRKYDPLKDNKIIENTTLEKIVTTIKIDDDFIYLCEEIAKDDFLYVYDFVVQLMHNTSLMIDLKHLHISNYNLVLSINKIFDYYFPLKIYTYNKVELINELEKHIFLNSDCVKISNSRILFFFEEYELINFFEYAHHTFDKRTIQTILRKDTPIRYSGDYIWETFVDIYMLAYEYKFDLTDAKLAFLKIIMFQIIC